MSVSTVSIEQLSVNTIRTLSMDAVQKANSGHPGTAMALAPVTYALWNNALRYDPEHPDWPARDRFVLSALPDAVRLHPASGWRRSSAANLVSRSTTSRIFVR